MGGAGRQERFGRSRRGVFLCAAACIAAGCGSGGGAQADPTELMTADSAFDAAVAEGGSAAWVQWFAADGAMIQPGVGEIRGRNAIGDVVAYLDQPGTSLRWTPRRADIAASGDLGWTTGTYVAQSPGPDGAPAVGTGIYVSIWRRQSDGSWQVVMDLGNPTTQPSG